jgi:hypothetical protein
MKRLVGLRFAMLALAGVGLMAAPPGAHSQTGPEVVYETYHDTSLPVREYPSELPAAAPALRVRPLPRRILPGVGFAQADAVEQVFALPTVSVTISHNFDGISDSANGLFLQVPPDENLAVGATQVVEVINTAYQVFSKSTGASVQAPKQISSIFTGVGGLCGQGPTSPNYTDPIVLYDKKAGRWFIAIVAADSRFSTGNECIAVSSTSDATGTYHRYAFSFGPKVFNDYDKFGVWPDAYYGAYNLFSPSKFLGAKACAYQRSAMLAGTAAKAICFTNANEFSFLPSDLDGTTTSAVGEPNFFVDLSPQCAPPFQVPRRFHYPKQLQILRAHRDCGDTLYPGLCRHRYVHSAAGNNRSTGFPGGSLDVPAGLSQLRNS